MKKRLTYNTGKLFSSSSESNVISVLLLNLIWTIPLGLVQPFISPYFFDLSKGDYFLTGLLIGLPLFTAIFSVFIFGWIVDKFGSKNVMIVGFLAFILLFITLIFIIDPILFFFDYIVLNSLLSCFTPAILKYASLTNKSHIFGSMSATTSLGYFIGVIISGFLFDPLGMTTIFYISLFVCILGLIITAISQDLRQSDHELTIINSSTIDDINSSSKNFFSILTNSKTLIVIYVIAIIHSFQVSIAGTFVSVYFINELHTPTFLIGIVFGLATLSGTVVSQHIGKVGEKRGFKKILIACYSGYFLVWISFAISVNDYLLPALFYTFPIYIGFIIAGPALISDHVNESKRGTFMGIFSVSQYIGLSSGTILGGLVGSLQGSFRFNFVIATFTTFILIIFIVLFFHDEKKFS